MKNRIRRHATVRLGDMAAVYLLDTETRQMGLCLVPSPLIGSLAKRRELLSGPEVDGLPWKSIRAWNVDSLVQIKLAGDVAGGGFAQGRTMRGSSSTTGLKFVSQRRERKDGGVRIVTVLRHPEGFRCEHALSWRRGDGACTVAAEVVNEGSSAIRVEMLSSFSLGNLTPFHKADAPGRLRVHRFRSAWSAEGRLETRTLEEVQLERSWVGHGVAVERFGQVGSLPVRGFFPWGAVEDIGKRVVWAAQLACPGSWQMEFSRRDDALNFSGGLADREFGHWMKQIPPGGSFTAPPAWVTVARGDVDDACDRLTSMQDAAAGKAPRVESDLPIVANEWCTSWGNPTRANLEVLADKLQGTPVKYLVIDAGWYGTGDWSSSHGDWKPSQEKFPGGIEAAAAAIRRRGLIPGLWFEMETCASESKAFRRGKHLLLRDGKPVDAGGRRFWDFRDPWVETYLAERVIGLLRQGGFGYLKVDYNETIGIGCDGAESPGEGLRAHLEGVQRFFRRIRRELPDLVIENCASGGHRLEPSFQAVTSMASFSDAHETPEIPVIAASVQRLILPRQSQIWAVLRKADTAQRAVYTLAATFLGRMCLSGDLTSLPKKNEAVLAGAQRLYRTIWPILKDGSSRRQGASSASYRHLTGWQAVVRTGESGREALVVAHTFGNPPASPLSIALPSGRWRIAGTFAEEDGVASLGPGALHWRSRGSWRGAVWHLKR